MAGFYATTTSLDTLMIGTTFDTATTALASQCIVWAENEVIKQLSQRYAMSGSQFALTTTSTVPPMITTMTEWLAMGYLYDNMSRGSKEGHTRAQRLIDRAMKNLKELINDQVDLITADGSTVGQKSGIIDVLENTSGYTPIFDLDDEKNWAIDSDQLNDINDSRD